MPQRHTPNQRIYSLDGLRGLLALVVCLNHSYMVIKIPGVASVWQQNPFIFHDLQSKLQQLFMFIGNGGAAVSLFFVLSGFVLGQSLSSLRLNMPSILKFYLKRFVRLYPVYLFIAIITAIYMLTIFSYETYPNSSLWFNWWMNFTMTAKEFLLNLAFIHTYLGGVTWTLRVILIASLVFPLFLAVSRKTVWYQDLAITVLLIIMSFSILNIENFRDFRYLYMFYLGLSLPKYKTFFTSLQSRIVNASLLVFIPTMLGFRYLFDEYRGGLVESVISFFIIGLCVYQTNLNSTSLLRSRIFQFLGKISYSLYLVHFSVLYVLSKLMFDYFPQLNYQDRYFLIHTVLFILSTGLSLFISKVIYQIIEKPSQAVSAKIK